MHAEMDLLSKLGSKAVGAKIFVYRFNNTNNPNAREAKNAKPCILCQHSLKSAGIARIHYIDDNGVIQVIKNRDLVELKAKPSNITHYFLNKAGYHHDNKFCPMDYVST